MSDEIVLVPFDPNWPHHYALARDELLGLLREPPILIEHIGSTAVPGLVAKPVIDIIVLVAAMPPVQEQLPALEAIGYEFRPAVSTDQRLFMRRHGPGGTRTHHLHVHTDREDVKRHIVFRDVLRRDASVRRAYIELKLHLAAIHGDDRQAYARGKDGFIDDVVQKAGGPPRAPFWNA